jgi:hypothetical protein
VSLRQDLLALVADSHQREVLEVLLTKRQDALRLRALSFEVHPHPRQDPGVYHEAEMFLAPFRQSHCFALVLLDVEFPGSPGAPATIQEEIQKRLDARGWKDRSRVIAIAPEFEAWVWSDSPHVVDILGQTQAQIRTIATKHDWWPNGAAKPSRPKELLSAVLRASRKGPPSAALFGKLAERVSVQRCADPAFARLRQTLQQWFGSPGFPGQPENVNAPVTHGNREIVQES